MNSRDRERKFSSSFLRKIRKPIVERKRRNRINKCLEELKEILLETMKRNGNTQVAKLDKADILEMTVQHLRQSQQQQLSVAMASNARLHQYQQGFNECAQETLRYMTTSGSYTGLLTSNINQHLSSVLSRDYENQSMGLCAIKTEHSETDEKECETPRRKCRSASPHASVSKRLQFSPLSSNVMGRQISERMSASTSNISTDNHRNSVLTIPPRLPVNADDASPQRNVWRPF